MLAKRLRILAVAGFAATAACFENSTGTATYTGTDLAGAYVLAEVNATPPPAVAHETSVDSTSDECYGVQGVTTYEERVDSSTANFAADGSVSLSISVSGICLDSDGRVLTSTLETSTINLLWTRSGNSITLSFPSEQDVPPEMPELTGHTDPIGVTFAFPFGTVDGGRYTMAALHYVESG